MTQMSRTSYQTYIDTNVASNGTRGITGDIANDGYEHLKDSVTWFDEGPLPAWLVGQSTFTPVLTDLVPSVDDPAGTPVWGKLTWQSIFTLFIAQGASTSFLTSGTLADARVAESNVTQHEAALTITESQISDLGAYVGAVNGLLKGDGAGNLAAAVAGTDYAAVSHTHTASQITDFSTAADARVAAAIGSTVQGYDADTLKADTADDLTAGYTTEAYDIGTVTGSTTTLDFTDRNNQRLVNNGAFTLEPPSSGEGTMIVKITNGASAGEITLSGFDCVIGQANLDTTEGNIFWCSIAVNGGDAFLNIIADSRNT